MSEGKIIARAAVKNQLILCATIAVNSVAETCRGFTPVCY